MIAIYPIPYHVYVTDELSLFSTFTLPDGGYITPASNPPPGYLTRLYPDEKLDPYWNAADQMRTRS